MLQECFSSDFLPGDFFRPQKVLLNLQLGSNPCVVGARDPESWDSFHAVVTDHQIFHGNEHGMAEMQLACNVRRRNDYAVRRFIAFVRIKKELG